MKLTRYLFNSTLGAGLLLMLSAPASAATVYSISGTASDGFEVGGPPDVITAESWSETTSFSGVDITALLGDYLGSGTITAYLTTQIGAGATSAEQVAKATISPATGEETDTLFTGLSLGPGTYYLVLSSANEATWWGNTTSTTTTASGVTGGPAVFADIGNGSPDATYAPGSTFESDGGIGLFFTASTSAPEPSTFYLLAAGLGAAAWLGRRKQI
jgi:hypothetical protein